VKRFNEATPGIVVLIEQLETSINGRQGTQEPHLASVNRLRARLAQARTVVRTNPISALGTLDAISKRATLIDTLSADAHQKYQAQQK
jgi:hypothetical protein